MQMIQAAEGNGELKEYERLTAASTVAETMPAICESFTMLPPKPIDGAPSVSDRKEILSNVGNRYRMIRRRNAAAASCGDLNVAPGNGLLIRFERRNPSMRR